MNSCFISPTILKGFLLFGLREFQKYLEGYEYWLTNILMKLGNVSNNSWKIRKVQADLCVILVQVNVKCSRAT